MLATFQASGKESDFMFAYFFIFEVSLFCRILRHVASDLINLLSFIYLLALETHLLFNLLDTVLQISSL